MCIASIYWQKGLLHGVVRLTAAYRPIDGRCLEQFVYGRSSNSRFIQIAPKDQSTLGRFFFFCRQSVSPVQHLRKIKIPKCPPTDKRNRNCLPMTGRWPDQGLFDWLFNDCLNWRNWPSVQKKYIYNWPDRHKISWPMKNDVDIGQAKTSWTADSRPDNQLFASKTIGRWSFSEMGLWCNPQSLLLPELISCV